MADNELRIPTCTDGTDEIPNTIRDFAGEVKDVASEVEGPASGSAEIEGPNAVIRLTSEVSQIKSVVESKDCAGEHISSSVQRVTAYLDEVEDVIPNTTTESVNDTVSSLGGGEDREEEDANTSNVEEDVKSDLIETDLGKSLHLRGMLHQENGEYVQGLDCIQRAYKLRLENFGATDANTLVSQQVLGEYFVLLNRGGDGLELLQSCYEARRKDGEESEETLDCMRALGKCMLAVGLVTGGLKILGQRYVAVVRRSVDDNLGSDHPRTLPARLDYAAALAGSGRHSAVPGLNLDVVVNNQKTVYGNDDPTTLKLMDQYAELLTKMGRTEQAKQLLLECVFSHTASLGPNHIVTLTSKVALAGAYVEMGRIKEAEELQMEACLREMQSQLGETHPSTILAMVKLAAIYNATNRNKEALEMFKTVHAVRSKSLGKDHELAMGVANNIASVYVSMERFQEGKDLYEETLELAEARLGKAHLVSTAVQLNFGQFLQNTGNLGRALTMYQDTLALCTETYGDKHPRSVLALESIGCVYLIQQRWQEAHDVFEKTMALKVGIYEETHPLSLITMENIATCKRNLGLKQEALAINQRLCKLKEESSRPQHVDAIKARVNLAIVMAELGDIDGAVALAVAAVQDSAAALGPDAGPVQEYTGTLGYFYGLAGQWEDAIRLTNIALIGTIKIFGESHHSVKALLARKVWMLQNSGRESEAAQLIAIMNAIPAADSSTTEGESGSSINESSPAVASSSSGAAGFGRRVLSVISGGYFK